ncbi:hypothetical protein D918_01979 [Trichuris suis]|nr:hypothetical protein D918_01979 [Trichuris suis]
MLSTVRFTLTDRLSCFREKRIQLLVHSYFCCHLQRQQSDVNFRFVTISNAPPTCFCTFQVLLINYCECTFHGCPSNDEEEFKAKALAGFLKRKCDATCKEAKNLWLSTVITEEANIDNFIKYDNCFRNCANSTIAGIRSQHNAIPAARQKQSLRDEAEKECMNQCFPDLIAHNMVEMDLNDQATHGACKRRCITWTESWSNGDGWVMYQVNAKVEALLLI